MSRVGKKPVALPAGVTAKVEGQTIAIKGGKGELRFVAPGEVSVSLAANQITVDPRNDTKRARAMWGTTRARLNNLVVGVTKGFEKKLEINGVGYKAAVSGKNLQLSLGYSHDVSFAIPQGVSIVTPKPTEIAISGIFSGLMYALVALPPEPYKGKGVKYSGEFIFRKEGKKK